MDNRREIKDRHHVNLIFVSKFIVVAFILMYVAGLFSFTSGSTKSFEEVAGPVDGMINKRRMSKASERDIKKLYGLNIGEYDGVLCCIAKNNLSSEEVIVVKVKEESQIKEVKDAVQKRLECRKEDFHGYAPDEEKSIDDAIVSIRGKFLFMAVGPDSEMQKDAFYNAL